MINLNKLIILSTALLLFIPVLLHIRLSSTAHSATIERNPADQDIIKGIELLYEWEFNQAEAIFGKIIKERPKDPIGYFYLSMVTWSQLASGFWSPEVVKQYLDRTEQTISIAKKKIQYGQADSSTYFFLGGALGFKGRLQLMQEKWLSSYFLAAEAIEALNTCLEMDPNNKDVLFGLGIYDYYTDQLSGVLRILSYLFLNREDKNEGLRKLHIAAEEAPYSSIEAKSNLIHIYLFIESDINKATILAEELANRFQNNPRYRFLLGVTYIRLDRQNEYKKTIKYFLEKAETDTSFMSAIYKARAFHLEAVKYLFDGQFTEARNKLNEVLTMADPSLDPTMAVWPMLKIGMSYDIEGNRQKAMDYYNRIIGLKNGAGAQFLAEKYLKEPPDKEDPFLGY